MPNSSQLILYSTGTRLAFNINERFYGGVHWVWCSPYFAPFGGPLYTNPPSSSPSEIYRDLRRATESGDLHNAKIKDNKAGILKGAVAKRQAGVIDAQQFSDINSILSAAIVQDFNPVLYVIPFDRVGNLATLVPVEQLAHPLSVEYIIETLPNGNFDIIQFPDIP